MQKHATERAKALVDSRFSTRLFGMHLDFVNAHQLVVRWPDNCRHQHHSPPLHSPAAMGSLLSKFPCRSSATKGNLGRT